MGMTAGNMMICPPNGVWEIRVLPLVFPKATLDNPWFDASVFGWDPCDQEDKHGSVCHPTISRNVPN